MSQERSAATNPSVAGTTATPGATPATSALLAAESPAAQGVSLAAIGAFTAALLEAPQAEVREDRPRALVTGSAVRVGRGIALRLAREGWFVHVHCREGRESEARETLEALRSAGGEGTVVVGDIATRAGCEALFAQLDAARGLDALVNNVGVYRTGPLATLSVVDWEVMTRSNLDGTFHCCQLAIPLLRPGAGIVNIGYVGVDHLAGTRRTAAYSATKAGILVLTRSLALELAEKRIRVNMVSPGQLDNSVDLPEDWARRIPLGRPGTVDDIAEAVAWLLSDRASYVTGQNLDVAGGLMLALRGE